jgi:hypothetical protein
MGFIGLFYSTSELVSIFSYILHLVFLITALINKLSESILGPLIDLTSSITPLLFAFIIM